VGGATNRILPGRVESGWGRPWPLVKGESMMFLVRIFSVLIALAGFTLFGAAGALAANGAITETITEQNVTETFVDVVPCGADEAALYDITITYNGIEHSTIGPKSIHFTFTQTGTFVAVPQDASLPTYTGHFATWGGFNENAKNASGTFTFSLHGTADDGSTIAFNGVEHFNVSASGVVNEFSFDRCH
jgi:hypothetical protein